MLIPLGVAVGAFGTLVGAGGGFILGRTPDKITLLEVVEAVEGPIVPNRCVINEGECPRDTTCNVHPVWVDVQLQVREILNNVTLQKLAEP